MEQRQILCSHCWGRPFGRGISVDKKIVFVCLNCGHKVKFGPEKAIIKDNRNWLFEVVQ